MYGVSDEFLTTIAGSHTITTRVEVYASGALLDDITEYVSDGSVTVDTRRQVRRMGSLTLGDVDASLIPQTAGDLLNPLSGNEIKIWRGAIVDGVAEECPLGVFRITKTTASEGTANLQLALSDRSWRVAREDFTVPYTVTAGTAVEDAIETLLQRKWSTIQTSLPTTNLDTPLLAFGLGGSISADPWAAAQKMASDAGYDLYFDVNGVAVMQQTSSLYVTPSVLSLGPGEVEVVLNATREWDGERAFNGCVVSGEGAGVTTPVRAEAWDTDPASPTYRYGPFGEIPNIYSSSTILTTEQAQAAADERLRRGLGIGGSLSWGQVVNPALEGSDVLTVVRPSLNVSDIFVIDQLTIPLSAGDPMTAIGRTRVSLEDDS